MRKLNDQQIKIYTAQIEAELEEESIRSKYMLQMEAQKGVAQISGVMASGAMSALNASAAMEYAEEE